jgi:hypothetical protein
MGRTIDGLPTYPSLSGCVNDVLLMDDFLRTRLGVPAERIKKLTARGSGPEPEGPRDLWPTKANIVAAFKELAQQAQPGDQVYIHYSGHGGRALTVFPDLKGADGLDESLVPTDFGQIENKEHPEDRYLRDVELALLLQDLVDRQLVVTAVLDSCHSGGAARGEEDDVAVRGGVEPDLVLRVPSDLVATPAALAAGWRAQARAATPASGWLPDPEGYTLLAACRALELAKEYPAPNGKRHGALSYWLWHTLQSPALNWEMVRQQVVARVHGAFASQTPQLQGVGNRAVFGGASLALPAGVAVLEVLADRVRLNAGQSAGVGLGAQYFVYRQGVADLKQTDQRLAVAEVEEVLDAEAWAKVVRTLGAGAIAPGALALLFDPGKGRQRTVRLKRGTAAADAEEAALASLAQAIEQSESRFVRVAAQGEGAGFEVGVTTDQRFEIRDGGGEPLPNLISLPVDQAGEVAYRLDHLARYFNVLELASPDVASRLAGKLEVMLMRTPEQPFDEPGGVPTVKDRQDIYYLRIRNLFDPVPGPPSDASAYVDEVRRRTMAITVLNQAPDWSIARFLPPLGDAETYYDLEPGETLLLPRAIVPGQPRELPALASAVPSGVDEAIDVLKVFASNDTTNYDSLQLPALDAVRQRASLVSPRAPQPERTWITTQVMVRVVR